MASDTKNPVEAARELVKALGAKIDDLKKSESTFTPADVVSELNKAMGSRIDAFKAELAKMEKAEADGKAALRKNIGNLPSDTPSGSQIADGDANRATPMPRSVFQMMRKAAIFESTHQADGYAKGAKAPKAGKEVGDDEGSGGQVKKGKSFGKAALPMSMPKLPALKPSGVPGAKAGEAPKAPSAPKAPGGTGPTKKMELPQSSEKANGGQMTKKMELPSTSEKANGGQMKKDEIAAQGAHKCPNCGGSGGKAATGSSGKKLVTACPSCQKKSKPAMKKSGNAGQVGGGDVTMKSGNAGQVGGGDATGPAPMAMTQKMELPQTKEKANGGKVTKKMELPASSEKANGGKITEGMSKAALSPVFAAHAKMKQQAMAADSHKAAMAGPAAAPGKAATLPTVKQHAERQSTFTDFMPKGNFGKGEK
jgi:ssDNA-binding Zn-finger/Zn-ribbon topoisomerase 1